MNDEEIMKEVFKNLKAEWLKHLEKESLDFNPITDMCDGCENMYKKYLLITIKKSKQEELFRIRTKFFEYVKVNNLRGFQIWLNKECEKLK